ncbi:magnesium transport protein CorA [Clostridium acetireducens DSM 10703]|uniref:Magnesium transport protein CorA n=1 Tax=Clostridium acetireducens DSM 10703 TaxID=1121290 RepID=A0A1E8EXP8_9CLOT|nr:magnesium transporter CorA family protein [Clostridium acetireducens]OFI05572.1 magnesium transport protein CorA [Clostridium acetireducens DSM 10703]
MVIYDILNNFTNITNKSPLKKSSKYWILTDIEELDRIKDNINIDDCCIKECKEMSEFSKINFYHNYIFIILSALEYYNGQVYCKNLYVFLSKEYLITTSTDELDIVKDLIEDIRDSKDSLFFKKNPLPCILLYYIIDRIIVKNYNVIASLEEEVDKIEIGILKNPKHQYLDRLINLRRQVYKIRKYLNPLRYIGDSLTSNENNIIEKENLVHFINLNKKTDKLVMALESLVQDLGMVREAFESEIANKTNELMKIFTLIATIFLPLNLISSIYGMNFKYIPFANTDYGYYFIIAIMIFITAILIYIFKKKKWL